MIALKGIIKNGQVIMPQRADLPDGTEVEILPLSRGTEDRDDSPMSPEEIARLLALMDQIEPIEMTEQERAAWEADRQARKELEKAQFNDHADKLRRMWE